jgi:hydrogenase nickel incorporation protein HypA/HybF
MHEISIARNLLELMHEQQRSQTFTRVKKAMVRVGALSGIDGAALRFAFDLMTKETCAEGCCLHIEPVAPAGKCNACGNKFEIKKYTFVCPMCDGRNITLLDGDQIVLSEIEVEMSEALCPN